MFTRCVQNATQIHFVQRKAVKQEVEQKDRHNGGWLTMKIQKPGNTAGLARTLRRVLDSGSIMYSFQSMY